MLDQMEMVHEHELDDDDKGLEFDEEEKDFEKVKSFVEKADS